MAITTNAMSSIPYTQQLAFFNANTQMSWTPKTLEEWTQQQEDNGREQIVDEDYITEYIDRVQGFDILVYKGRELSLELWPLTVGSDPLLVYKGDHVNWVIDDMKTTYKSLDKLIEKVEPKDIKEPVQETLPNNTVGSDYFVGRTIRNWEMQEYAKVNLTHMVTGVRLHLKSGKRYLVKADIKKSTNLELTPQEALKRIQRYVQKKESGLTDRTIKPCIYSITFP
tara:strand:+ start:279 stop:953 length:675 start_codon:yes stop_codon:yes gene_type:complete